jgi:large subunit ribosomal protein L6
MSRIGKKPVPIEGNAKVAISGRTVQVEAGNNKLSFTHRPEVKVTVDQDAKQVVVERLSESREARALHGTTRARIANMIEGVTKGFTRELEINGVGWSGRVQGQKVVLSVGYADQKEVQIPAGVKVEVQQNRIKVSGADKQLVGQVAAEIRAKRPPEPYNGKGIKYTDEHIIRKEGKAFASG